jgi:opacity protein-like surface antigen
MKRAYVLLSILLSLPLAASAQLINNFEAAGGYAHVSGDGGLNGFNVDVAAFFRPRVALAADYDGVYDTSNIGTFQITSVGLVTSKNHLQDYMIGPRIYFPGLIKTKNKTINLLNVFVEPQFGGSHLNSEIIQAVPNIRTGTSDSGFTYSLGGGADFRVSPHWAARTKIDLLRTHLANEGQSRVRFILEIAYFLKPRK